MNTSPRSVSPWWHNPNRISLAAMTALLALFVSLVALASPPSSSHTDASCQASCTTSVRGVATIGMTVSDMSRSLEFYQEVLDFKLVSDVEFVGEQYERLQGIFGLRMRVCTLQLGDESLELTEYLTGGGRPIPPDSRSNDHWFQHIAIIVSDMDAAYARLREHSVKHASTGPQTLPKWNTNAADIQAFYFRDPDNHVLEVLAFPAGKGAAKWHAHRSESVFLGIDHTAIVVGNTDASLAFYRDTLGMEVIGTSENYGTEQEHLNNVFGARLRITTLHCLDDVNETGPSVELLEYLAPTDGKPYPSDSRANDLWHWQVTMRVADAPGTERVLRSANTPHVSPGLVEFEGDPSHMLLGTMVRDPDGHAVRLVQFAPTELSAAAK